MSLDKGRQCNFCAKTKATGGHTLKPCNCSNGTCHKSGWKTHKKQCKEHSQGEENILVNPSLSGSQQAVDEFSLGILPDLCKFLCVPFLDGLLDGPATPYPLHIIFEYKPSSLPLRQQFQIAAVNPTSKDLYLQWLTEVLNDSTTLVRSAALWDEEEADEARKLVSASFSESGRSPPRIRLVFSAYKFNAPKAGVAAQPGAVMVHHAMHFVTLGSITPSGADARNAAIPLPLKLDAFLKAPGQEGSTNESEAEAKVALVFSQDPGWSMRAMEWVSLHRQGAPMSAQDLEVEAIIARGRLPPGQARAFTLYAGFKNWMHT